ncbi:MAG TPA: response regulator [Candidatus Aquabacterium excrementipullorum]|nr:response regulator [Candidatus Aquabacterium excrementipullorum]
MAIGVVARSAYIDLRTTALDEVQRLADGLTGTVERELDKRMVMARTLSSSTALQLNDLERFYTEARRATRGADSWVAALRPDAQVLNTTIAYQAGFSVPRLPAGGWLNQGESIYFSTSGAVVKQPFIGVMAAQLASPVDYNVVVAFSPSVLDKAVAKQAPPHHAIVAVVDSDMRVMSRSKDPSKWRGTEATWDMKERARTGKLGYQPSVTLDGVPALTYLSQPNRYGWRTIIALPEASLNKEAGRAAANAVGMAIALLGVSLLFALFVAHSISEPIMKLKDAAEALGEERVPAPSKTGILETDLVAKALREAGLRTKESAELLEARVNEAVERTADVQQKLAEAQKREALGRLAGGVAHDFNNLLQTISAALHLLTPNVPDGPPRRMLDSASRATGKAAGLVKQMLAFGRAQKLEPAPVDINDFLLRICELACKAAGPNVAIRAHVEPRLPAAFVDSTQLELALLNLIFNARDAMQGRGNIDIRAAIAGGEAYGVSTPAQTRFIQLEVQDDGPGMDAATQQKAFDPYFTTKPIGSGTGLGLAQVHSFARQSGGSAHIQSAPGHGTTVQMFLPSTQAGAASKAAQAAGAVAPARALRVLMVEDDPLVASVVLPAIEAEGHDVTHCASADEAKQRMQDGNRFDVVFSDIVMPGSTTGYDLAKWCSEQVTPIPVVLATGYSAQAPDPDVLVLRKPYDLKELMRALQEASNGAVNMST